MENNQSSVTFGSDTGLGGDNIPISYAYLQLAKLEKYVRTFQAALDRTHDVGFVFANNGPGQKLAVDSIRYEDPDLFAFSGVDCETGDNIIVIQHATQLSIMLCLIDKSPDEPYRPIVIRGFTAD